jgi:peptidoglycan/LPS O-acetylase OafA/YrhL
MQRNSIPALTGLRFIAAACVVLSHALPKIVPMDAPPAWYLWLGELSGIGMPLFFVLSGFVIHYNYAGKLADRPMIGTYNFFVARFARLYPLYIACLAYDWLHGYAYQQLPEAASAAIPYYLTMTQTWTYQLIGEHNLIYMPGVMTPLTWSISTEWFFYCSYPIVCLGLYRMRGLAAVLRWGGIFLLAATAFVMAEGHFGSKINAFAVARYGGIADVATPDSFLRWLNYFSPYAQLPNFIFGCLVADIHDRLKDRAVSAQEQKVGLWLLLAALIWLFLTFTLIYSPAVRAVIWVMNDDFPIGPPLALVIFCCARYRNPIVKALSARWMVFCGEVSYSIYLLHFLILMAFRWEAAKVTDGQVAIGNSLILAVALMSIVGTAYVTYSIIEVPGRRVLTRLLSIRAGAVREASPRQPA